jgi:hypothetical protein
MNSNYQRLLANFGALVSWFTVITQLVLSLQNSVIPPLQTVVKFISYFTILTNTLVALFFTASLLPNSRLYAFFSRKDRGTAIAVYITIVCVVYQVLLRPIWNPEGLQRIVDELLHSFIPFYFVYYWFTFIDKTKSEFSNIVSWSVYLLVYIGYSLMRGAIAGIYPYPFIDVTQLGYPMALLNTLGVLVFFVLISTAFIIIAKRLARN